MGEARDWGLGIPLKASLLGQMNRLEVHHIFPKARLYEKHYERRDVNALANFCFLTKDTNLDIRDRPPREYFPEVESAHPGSLASQWIPMDEKLWDIKNYLDFLRARRELLAGEANQRLADLLHGDTSWLEGVAPPPAERAVAGGITSEDEEGKLRALNDWVIERGFPAGEIAFDYSDPVTGQQKAIFDLVWSSGLQRELSAPVAVLLNEGDETLALANAAGFRCFTSINQFKSYVRREILGEDAIAA